MKKILLLGAAGMLGHVLFKELSSNNQFDVYATVRSPKKIDKWFPQRLIRNIIHNVDANKTDEIDALIGSVVPDLVINCIGITKQRQIEDNYLVAINVNACFPHHLASMCQRGHARLIQIGSDGVFDGRNGMYSEGDDVCAVDFYGMTKCLGEVSYTNCLTLRTSIIGHELKGKSGLVEWFLAQGGEVKGYKNVIYSGLPTVEMARVIGEYVIPNDTLQGIYHLSSEPISKYDLLHLIADRYGKEIKIQPLEKPVMDRSLDSSAFRSRTGYIAPPWPDLVDQMYVDYITNKEGPCLI